MESLSLNALLPLLIVMSPMLTGIVILCLNEESVRLRRTLNLGGNLFCVGLVALLLAGVYRGDIFESRIPLLPNMDIVLHADALSLLFVSLSAVLWLLTTIYAVGYLKNTKHRSRFFGFFSLCVSATLGIALAGNLITFLIFYELLTLTTYPLVVHKGNKASINAGRVYLSYTMGGGALLLAGVVWLKALVGPLEFASNGVLAQIPGLDPTQLTIIFALLMGGLGVKAALVPLHGWLPVAMAAPAPVSALLHAVAVVKAGAFGIIRVVYDVYGIEFARDLGLTMALAGVAAFTIVYGSVRAVFQNDIKKRLAYSTVSQVSYIALGTAIAGPVATIGGMVHLVHQGLMKITMFFCAGNLAETLGIHKISEMNGVGRRMPLTMAAFTLAALGMIGLPPIAGFVSKWYLGSGALEVGAYWILGVLAASSILNAIYFLPMLYAAWFKEWDESTANSQHHPASWMLLLPPVATALLAVAAGLFASSSFSPLSWAKLIAAREYGQEFSLPIPPIEFGIPYLYLAIVIPLALAFGILIKPLQNFLIKLTPLAALPVLLLAIVHPFADNSMSWLFFTSTVTLDISAKYLLIMAALLWGAAGLYGLDYLRGDAKLARYSMFFLTCMSGSFGLILAQDIYSFITFFTLMSFSAYGLVIHSGTEEARLAGRSYISWVVIGEIILFAGLVGFASTTTHEALPVPQSSAQPFWVSLLLILGFGIKAGMLGLHMWLPRAHPVAPVPASALLSGLMVKAGLLGWWRFLPMGEASLPDLGLFMVIIGLAGAFVAAVLGVIQQNIKTVLAYSTISQMGILTMGVGACLMEPSLWSAALPALLLYALHHGFAKATLFFAAGFNAFFAGSTHQKIFVWACTATAALIMAGLPFTSGAIVKLGLKAYLYKALHTPEWLNLLLLLTGIGTTCLMIRFLILIRSNAKAEQRNANHGHVNQDDAGSHSVSEHNVDKHDVDKHDVDKHSTAATPIGIARVIAMLAVTLASIAFVPVLVTTDSYFADTTLATPLWSSLWPLLAGVGLSVIVFMLHSRTRLNVASLRKVFEINSVINPYKIFNGKVSNDTGHGHEANTSEVKHDSNLTSATLLDSSANNFAKALIVGVERLHPGMLFLGCFVAISVALAIRHAPF